MPAFAFFKLKCYADPVDSRVQIMITDVNYWQIKIDSLNIMFYFPKNQQYLMTTVQYRDYSLTINFT